MVRVSHRGNLTSTAPVIARRGDPESPFETTSAVHFFPVKRWYYFALAAALVAAIVYVYAHWGGQDLGTVFGVADADVSTSGHMQWRTLERPGDSFKVDLPADEKELQVPAFNEQGGSEPVKMLVTNPSGDVTYAVTWEDNPPVARVAQTAERTLNLARDGMLARTETTILSESRGFTHDDPWLDVLARNSGGGILNARIIVAEDRLYILMALFPSSAARREKDVNRFFNSFVPARPTGIPEAMPAASTH